ncbi:hypothetical protein CHUAL_001993 [Chamberlinius hualienensis]
MNKTDVKCRICLSILIKPVILPCTHEFCLECFEKHMSINSGCCPLCRRRVGNWARNAKKNNELVNKIRWHTIQRNFPDKVSRRLNGLTTSKTSDIAPNSSDTGQTAVITVKQNISLDNKDQHVKEMGEKTQSSSSHSCTAAADVPGCSASSNKTKTAPGVSRRGLIKRSASIESEDSISPELNHFRPIKLEPKTPPQFAFEQPVLYKPCLQPAKPRDLSYENKCNSKDNVQLVPTALAFVVPQSLKTASKTGNKHSRSRASMDSENDDGERGNSSNPRRPSKMKKCKLEVKSLENMRSIERRSICTKRQQETEDYKLALKIQKNINRGVYDVDRSCSGERPYFLRKRN